MERVRALYDRTGCALTVWFDNPTREYVCEEIDEDIVLMKDEGGRLIGFERLNCLPKEGQADQQTVPVDVQLI